MEHSGKPIRHGERSGELIRHGERSRTKWSEVEPGGQCRALPGYSGIIYFPAQFGGFKKPPRGSTSPFDFSLLRRLTLRTALTMTFGITSLRTALTMTYGRTALSCGTIHYWSG
ncbi:MAG: hypothetical protein LC662_12620 [Rhodothermaceae bacterium]|nr:hypothetical protein [Rhodothermaceae bacterium]